MLRGSGALAGWGSFLPWVFEFGGVVSPGFELGEMAIEVFLGDGGGAGEDPEEIFAGAADDDLGVVLVEGEDAVVAIEGAEERHPELADAGIAFEFGDSGGVFDLAVFGAAVDDADAAVGAAAVLGADVVHVSLEPVRHAGDFIPLAEVAFEDEAGDGGYGRLRRGRLGCA